MTKIDIKQEQVKNRHLNKKITLLAFKTTKDSTGINRQRSTLQTGTKSKIPPHTQSIFLYFYTSCLIKILKESLPPSQELNDDNNHLQECPLACSWDLRQSAQQAEPFSDRAAALAGHRLWCHCLWRQSGESEHH